MDRRETITCFMPIYHRDEFVHQCLDAFIENHYHDMYSVELVMINNGCNDGLHDRICDLHDKNSNFILIDNQMHNGGNLGKAKSITLAAREYNQFDYFINLDSDLVLDIPGWPGKLADCFKYLEGRGYNLGMVATAQCGDNKMPEQPCKINIHPNDNEYTFHFGGEVAGSCFLTHRDIWFELEYPNKGKFGGVDGIFRWRVANQLELKCGYIEQIEAYHLDDSDKYEEYRNWKEQVQSNLLKHGMLSEPEVTGANRGPYDE